jgi:hypothetical protein
MRIPPTSFASYISRLSCCADSNRIGRFEIVDAIDRNLVRVPTVQKYVNNRFGFWCGRAHGLSSWLDNGSPWLSWALMDRVLAQPHSADGLEEEIAHDATVRRQMEAAETEADLRALVPVMMRRARAWKAMGAE